MKASARGEISKPVPHSFAAIVANNYPTQNRTEQNIAASNS
jgi:hypothetical protein